MALYDPYSSPAAAMGSYSSSPTAGRSLLQICGMKRIEPAQCLDQMVWLPRANVAQALALSELAATCSLLIHVEPLVLVNRNTSTRLLTLSCPFF
jgi:hypothetical protein